MPLIPPQFVQLVGATTNNFAGASGSVAASFTNATAGHLLIAVSAGENNTGGTSTISISGISDTFGSAWNQIAAVSYSGGDPPISINPLPTTVGVWYAIANGNGADTVSVSWAGTGASSKQIWLTLAEFKNVSGFDTLISNISSSNPATAGTFTTLRNNELLISCWHDNPAFSTTVPFPWNLNQQTNAIFYNNVAQAGSAASIPLSNGAVNPTIYFGSIAGFFSATATDPNNGNVFLSQYPGMPWMKNVMFLVRQYWDQGLSSPYVGQIFPSPNTGGAKSGGTYPY